jgi:hypothetical protein
MANAESRESVPAVVETILAFKTNAITYRREGLANGVGTQRLAQFIAKTLGREIGRCPGQIMGASQSRFFDDGHVRTWLSVNFQKVDLGIFRGDRASLSVSRVRRYFRPKRGRVSHRTAPKLRRVLPAFDPYRIRVQCRLDVPFAVSVLSVGFAILAVAPRARYLAGFATCARNLWPVARCCRSKATARAGHYTLQFHVASSLRSIVRTADQRRPSFQNPAVATYCPA